MPIQPLPPSTTRVLGSCQALTTPSSLVKELIDNAIDARATSIDVIISANTLDKIEVRDNGHGIAPEDLDALGRRGHTSKLKNFEELRIVGRSSLGFRGEALASAVTLGDVAVTTRTEGDPVAIMVKLKNTGGISSQSSVSHPIGTTVCVSRFLSSFPVRRQTSLKDSAKTISKIKDILQSYALARLHVRLSLKVLKTGKGNWSFVPRPTDSIKEAVIQVAGNQVAGQCIEKTNFSEDACTPGGNDARHQHSSAPKSSFAIQAFLPRPDADFSKLKGGQHASIDSRPISCIRGSLKKIMAVYKQNIRAAASKTGQEIPKDPFIYLKITCPIGSYDPNIEPAKDDVLFEDENAILMVAEELFKSMYTFHTLPEVENPNERFIFKPNVIERPASQHLIEVSNKQVMVDIQNPDGIRAGAKRKWEHTMSEEYVEGMSDHVPDFPTLHDHEHDHELSPPGTKANEGQNTPNPWIIAKLNAPATTPRPQNTNTNFPTPRQQRQRISHIYETPPASSDELFITEDMPTSLTGTQSKNALSRSDPAQSSVEAWISRQQPHVISGLTRLPRGIEQEEDREFIEVGGFVTARALPTGIPWSPPPTKDKTHKRAQRGFNKPFVLPKKAEILFSGGLNASEKWLPVPPRGTSSVPLQDLPRLNVLQLDDDADVTLDFERRKATATKKLREENRSSRIERQMVIGQVDQDPSINTQNAFYNAAVSRMEAKINGTPTEETLRQEKMEKSALPDGDPRAYLMRRQKSMTAYLGGPLQGPKLKRAKTMLLPLETIPKSFNMHNLVRKMSTDTASIMRSIQLLSRFDEYSKSGTQSEGLKMTNSSAEEVEKSLNDLMKTRMGHFVAV